MPDFRKRGNSPKQQYIKATNSPDSTNSFGKVNGDHRETSLLSWLHSLDVRYSETLSVCAEPEARLGSLRPLMKVLEISCHGIPWIFGTLLSLLSVHRTDHIEILLNLLLSLLLDVVVIGLIKLLIRRNRPINNKEDMFATVSVDQFSFPSGHTSRAVLLAVLFVQNFSNSSLLSLLAIVWATCISISRVMLGRHHITDVFCGSLVGVLLYIVVDVYWLPEKQCLQLLEPYFGHFHM